MDQGDPGNRQPYGKIDVLVNNAGTGARATVEETTTAAWDGQMTFHAKGVFLGTKHAIPEMRRAGGGSIINVSSIYGLVGSPTSTAYHAAKGAIRLFTKSAAVQYAGGEHPGELGASRLLLDSPHGPSYSQEEGRETGLWTAYPWTLGQRRRHRLRHPLPGLRRVFVRDGLRTGNRQRHHRPVAGPDSA